MRRAQEVDEAEDKRYGKDRRGDELPEELAFREGRLEKIQEAMAELEAEAETQAEQAAEAGKTHPGVPEDKAQRNFTDPESRIMPGPGGKNFLQAYNCQAVVDHEHQVIIAARATNQASDKQQAVAMIQEAIANLEAVPKEISADAGYYSAPAVADLQDLGWTPTSRPRRPAMATGRRQHPEDASPKLSPPGTGCGASCRLSEDVRDMLCAWRPWSRCSARSSRAGVSAVPAAGFAEGAG